jgi:proteasome accessory factor B
MRSRRSDAFGLEITLPSYGASVCHPAGHRVSTTKRTKKHAEAGLRLLDAQKLLLRPTGATFRELMEELSLSRSTADRYLRSLAFAGTRIDVIGERDGSQVRRIAGKEGTHVVAFTLEELVWLKVFEAYASCFEGTGIDETFRRICNKTLATLKPKDRARVLDLSRKIFDVPEHVRDYSDKAEVLDQIVSALLEEQPLVIKQESKTAGRRRFRIDPYTLVTHKRALYLVGLSHHHKAIRTFAIDGIADATRQRDESFVYPKSYDPRKVFEGAFGIIQGEETEVTIRFDGHFEPWVRGRKFHPSQTLEKKGAFLYLTMRLRGTKELLPWIMSWGANAAVVSPPTLRDEWLKHAQGVVRMAQEIAAAEEKRLGSDDSGDETNE